jgi:hypothetical protein
MKIIDGGSFLKAHKEWGGAVCRPPVCRPLGGRSNGAKGGGQMGQKGAVCRPPTKDIITKDNTQKTVLAEPTQPHQQFIKKFGEVYTAKTGQPFDSKKQHFVIIAQYMKKHGVDALRQKADILAGHCEKCDVFFTKNEGWSSFTIETLISQWNRLIPQTRMSDQEIKDQNLLKGLKELRDRDERINREIGATSGN